MTNYFVQTCVIRQICPLDLANVNWLLEIDCCLFSLLVSYCSGHHFIKWSYFLLDILFYLLIYIYFFHCRCEAIYLTI